MIFVLGIVVGFIVGGLSFLFFFKKRIRVLNMIIKQLYDKWAVANSWLYQRDAKKRIADSLYALGIKRVAIYGMGDLGQHLLFELEETGIEVAYIVDRDNNIKSYGYPVYTPCDTLPDVDAMIITAIQSYDKICNLLKNQMSTQFMCITDLA